MQLHLDTLAASASYQAPEQMGNANVITQARLLASSSTEAAAWLAARPVSTFGKLLDDASLRISVGLRLGARICTAHKCVCGGMRNQWDPHGLSCKQSRGRQGRAKRVHPESSGFCKGNIHS